MKMQQAQLEVQSASPPEDILPSFGNILKYNEEMVRKAHGADKKQKLFSLVQPIRQSMRIDRSKNMIDKAEEMKQWSNLEIPASQKM